VNQGYDPPTAVRVLRNMMDYGILLVEEPVGKPAMDGLVVVEELEIQEEETEEIVEWAVDFDKLENAVES
jgi:L-alanine-DL-glutamate epimerase-like enolase superfamily enzyme